MIRSRISQYPTVNRNHPLNRGRITWWLTIPGLDGGKSWYDLMGMNHGAFQNMTSGNGWRGSTRPGSKGHVLFDASAATGRAVFGASNLTPTVKTAAFWALLNNNSFYSLFLQGANSFSDGAWDWSFWFNSATLNFRPLGSTGFSYNYTSNFGQWTRILMVRADFGGTARGYINGVQVGTSTPASLTNANILRIGLTSLGGSTSPNGAIDDATIWDRPLSASEILADYEISRRGYPGVLNYSRRTLYSFPSSVVGPQRKTSSSSIIGICYTGQRGILAASDRSSIIGIGYLNSLSSRKTSSVINSIIGNCNVNYNISKIARPNSNITGTCTTNQRVILSAKDFSIITGISYLNSLGICRHNSNSNVIGNCNINSNLTKISRSNSNIVGICNTNQFARRFVNGNSTITGICYSNIIDRKIATGLSNIAGICYVNSVANSNHIGNNLFGTSNISGIAYVTSRATVKSISRTNIIGIANLNTTPIKFCRGLTSISGIAYLNNVIQRTRYINSSILGTCNVNPISARLATRPISLINGIAYININANSTHIGGTNKTANSDMSGIAYLIVRGILRTLPRSGITGICNVNSLGSRAQRGNCSISGNAIIGVRGVLTSRITFNINGTCNLTVSRRYSAGGRSSIIGNAIISNRTALSIIDRASISANCLVTSELINPVVPPGPTLIVRIIRYL